MISPATINGTRRRTVDRVYDYLATGLDKVQVAGLCVFAAGTAFSISFTNWSVFPFVLLPLVLWADLTRRNPAYRTALDIPLLAVYASAVASSFASYYAGGAEFMSRSFSWVYRYTAPLAFYAVAFSLYRRDKRVVAAMFIMLVAAATANSGYAIYQFCDRVLHGVHVLTNRPGGRMFYMTYGGVMAAVCSLTLVALVKAKIRLWARIASASAFAIMLGGLAVSLVRSAWLGFGVAFVVIAVIAERRLLWAIPAVIVVALLIAPREITDRAASLVRVGAAFEHAEPTDPDGESRLGIWKTYVRIAGDYPVFGIGLHNARYTYDRYKDPGSIESEIPHAHNNYLQAVVERGIVGLAAFLALVGALFVIFVRAYRRGPPGSKTYVIGLAGVGIMSGFLVEGLFEYTFGDFEIMILIYGLAAIAVALTRREADETADRADTRVTQP
ncbi:MAG: O-antigen ligase family protein [Candidatus Coatesbacteria bacterium]|nr:MAG: O-antigen ligase family protein [Candidatus Coatesbacteria bacterium]